MKKFLFSLSFFIAISMVSYGQLSLNEFYTTPQCATAPAPNTDWFELYNGTGNPVNLDCYQLVVIYYTGNGANKVANAYVLDMPQRTIQPGGFFVFAGYNPFCYQGGSFTMTAASGYNWNSATLGTDGGGLKHYVLNASNVWVNDITYTGSGTPLYNLLALSNGSAKYNFFFYNTSSGNSKIVNALLFGYSSSTLPTDISSLPALNTTIAGTCAGTGITGFSSTAIPAIETVTPNAGTDNGFYRTYNGICGTWQKGANNTAYTPGITNNPTPPPAGTGTFNLSISSLDCSEDGLTYSASINVTPGAGSPYPITYNVITDNSPFGSPINPVPGPEDVQFTSGTYDNGDGLNKFTVPALVSQTAYFINASNAAGCFSATIYVPAPACATLPVNMKAFTATRKNAAVDLVWVTSTELNNSGFEVQRQYGSGGWQKLSFVATKALNGNSNEDISYSFTDPNTSGGITNYRIKQVDIDGKPTYSVIRAVRGMGQRAKTVVYPNPSSNGKVNIVFDDAGSIRDVSLMDMSGRTIKQWIGVSNNIRISDLAPGSYSVRVVTRSTGEQSIEKIVVSKQ